MIIFSSQPPLVFGDNSFASVSIPSGTAVPGCEITSSCFAPTKVAIAQGGQVTWSNDDNAAHTVTSGTPSKGFDGHFDSGILEAGSTFSVSLDDSGTYPYLCMVHPWMKGTIIVEDTKPEHEPEPEVTEEIEHEPEPEPEVPPPAPTGTDVIMGLGTAVPGCEETNSCFSPSTFSIDSGEYVIWYNADTAYHTVTSGDPADPNSVGAMFDSSLFGEGSNVRSLSQIY